MQNRSDELEWQWRKLVVLEKVVQILLEHLKHKTRVVLVLETLERSHKVELVRILLAQPAQDGHLDLALSRVRRMVLQDLDGHNLARALFPALDHLAKGAASQELQHLQNTQTRKRNVNIRFIRQDFSASAPQEGSKAAPYYQPETEILYNVSTDH